MGYYQRLGIMPYRRKYILLRKELRFNPSTYYIVIIINFIFRIAWGVYLFPKSFRITVDFHYVTLGLGVPLKLQDDVFGIYSG